MIDKLPLEIFEQICDYVVLSDLQELSGIRLCSNYYVCCRLQQQHVNKESVMDCYTKRLLERTYNMYDTGTSNDDWNVLDLSMSVYQSPSGNTVEVGLSGIVSGDEHLATPEMFVHLYILEVNALKSKYFGSTDYQVLLEKARLDRLVSYIRF